ncbi:MAG: M56 family metallopeptidase [Gemmatimonadaceae bacterium]
MSRHASEYLSKPLAAREHARRRTLLLSIGVLIVLSTSPVFGHHLMRSGETLLRGTDRIGELCLVALHVLLAPVHEVFHVLVIVGVLYATWDRLRAWQRLHSSLRAFVLARAESGDPIWVAARAAGVEPDLIWIVDDSANPAFTAGWWRPSIYLSRQLTRSLSSAELAALIAHEGAHVARRDPLRLSMFRFLGRTLFWLPALSRLAADMADEAEIDADDRAAGTSPLVLASAIVSVAEWSRQRHAWAQDFSGAVGFAQGDMIERRVRRLAGEDVPMLTHVTRRSIIAAVAALALVLTSGVLMAHPLPDKAGGHMSHGGRGSANCGHHEGPALLHLFCPGLGTARASQPCPHFAGRTAT